MVCHVFYLSVVYFRSPSRLSESRLLKCFFFPFVFVFLTFLVEKSNIVSKREVSKFSSINIDSFTDVYLLRNFFHNSNKQFS